MQHKPQQPIPVYIEKTKYPEPVNYTAGIGFIFFLIGQYIPYLLGDHHDPVGQLAIGVLAGGIGIVIGAIVNLRIRLKEKVMNKP